MFIQKLWIKYDERRWKTLRAFIHVCALGKTALDELLSTVCTSAARCAQTQCTYMCVQNCSPRPKTAGCWLVCHGRLCVRACVCYWGFVCVYACIHLVSAGFPVQSPQSDTADDGCAAVICFICPGVSLASSANSSSSSHLRSCQKMGNHPSVLWCYIHTHTPGKKRHLFKLRAVGNGFTNRFSRNTQSGRCSNTKNVTFNLHN